MATQANKTTTKSVSNSKTATTTKTTVEQVTPIKDSTENTNITSTQTNSLDATSQLIEMMQQMKSQLDSLSTELTNTKAELASTKEELDKAKENNSTTNVVNTANFAELKSEPITVLPPVQEYQTSVQSNADKFLEILATRKSDKEVTIVHNREIVGGGTTHLALSNMTIDFTHFGETRTISMLQFEELTSRYRGFFNREIILVADKDRAIAEEYGVPCVQRKDGAVLGRADFERLGTMSIEALTNLYNSLTPNDKKFMLNYWLGQCYNRTPGFYDRYKIESLNALSKTGVFDTLIAFMNGEVLNSGRTQSQNTNQQQSNIVGKA